MTVCDHLGVPPRLDIIFDIEHVFSANNIKEFNLNEFEATTSADVRALLGALRWNNYFTRYVT
jgi:hypothetical protein